MRKLMALLASVVLGVGVAATAWSSEADELRAKAKTLQKQAEQLSQEGRRDEAEKLGREVKELLQAAQKHDQKPDHKSPKAGHGEHDELQQMLKNLAEKEQALKKSNDKEGLAELQKQRAKLEHALAERKEHSKKETGPKHADSKPSGKHAPELPEALADAGRRIKHIQVAVENLHAAGMHDIAEELAKRAEGMQRELQQAHEQFAKEKSSPGKGKQAEPGHKHADPDRKHADPDRKHAQTADDDLRQEIQRLRAELNELRGEIKKRP